MDQILEEALELVTEKLPLPSSRAGQLGLLRKILSKRYIESIHLELDEPITVVWHKSIVDLPLGEDAIEDIEEVFTRIAIHELVITGPVAVSTLFLHGCLLVDTWGCKPSHIVVSTEQALLDMFNISSLHRVPEEPYPVFAGLYVVESDLVEQDSFVVLGSPMRGYLLSQVDGGVVVHV